MADRSAAWYDAMADTQSFRPKVSRAQANRAKTTVATGKRWSAKRVTVNADVVRDRQHRDDPHWAKPNAVAVAGKPFALHTGQGQTGASAGSSSGGGSGGSAASSSAGPARGSSADAVALGSRALSSYERDRTKAVNAKLHAGQRPGLDAEGRVDLASLAGLGLGVPKFARPAQRADYLAYLDARDRDDADDDDDAGGDTNGFNRAAGTAAPARPSAAPKLTDFVAAAAAYDDGDDDNGGEPRDAAAAAAAPLLEPPLPVQKLLRQVSSEAKAGHISGHHKEHIKRLLAEFLIQQTARSGGFASVVASQLPADWSRAAPGPQAPVLSAAERQLAVSTHADRAAVLRAGKAHLPRVDATAATGKRNQRVGPTPLGAADDRAAAAAAPQKPAAAKLSVGVAHPTDLLAARGEPEKKPAVAVAPAGDSKAAAAKSAAVASASTSSAAAAPVLAKAGSSTDASKAAAAKPSSSSSWSSSAAAASVAADDAPAIAPLLRAVSDVERSRLITPQMKQQLQALIRSGVRRPNASSLFGAALDEHEPIDFLLDAEAIRRRIPKPKPLPETHAARAARAAAAGRARAAALWATFGAGGAANLRHGGDGSDAAGGGGRKLTDDELAASLEFMELDPDRARFDGRRRMLPLSRDTLPILYAFFDAKTFLVAATVNRLWFAVAANRRWTYLFDSARRCRDGTPLAQWSPFHGGFTAGQWAETYRLFGRNRLAPKGHAFDATAVAATAVNVPTHCQTVPIIQLWERPRKPVASAAATASAGTTSAGSAGAGSARSSGSGLATDASGAAFVPAEPDPVMASHDLWLALAHLDAHTFEVWRVDRAAHELSDYVRAKRRPPPRAQLVHRFDTYWSHADLSGTCRADRVYALDADAHQLLLPADDYWTSGRLHLYGLAATAPANPDDADVAPHPLASFVVPSVSVPLVFLKLVDGGARLGRLVVAALGSGELLVWTRTGTLVHWLFAPPGTADLTDPDRAEDDAHRVWRTDQASRFAYRFATATPSPLTASASAAASRQQTVPALAVRVCTAVTAIDADRMASSKQSRGHLSRDQWEGLMNRRYDDDASRVTLVDLRSGAESRPFFPYRISCVADVALVWLSAPPTPAGRVDPTFKPQGYVLTAHTNGTAVCTDLHGQSWIPFDADDEGDAAPAPVAARPAAGSAGGRVTVVLPPTHAARVAMHVDTDRATQASLVWTVRSSRFGVRCFDVRYVNPYLDRHADPVVAAAHRMTTSPLPAVPTIFTVQHSAAQLFTFDNGQLTVQSWTSAAPSGVAAPSLVYGAPAKQLPSTWDGTPDTTAPYDADAGDAKAGPTGAGAAAASARAGRGHPLLTCSVGGAANRYAAVVYTHGGVDVVDLHAHPRDGRAKRADRRAAALDEEVAGFRVADLVYIFGNANGDDDDDDDAADDGVDAEGDAGEGEAEADGDAKDGDSKHAGGSAGAATTKPAAKRTKTKRPKRDGGRDIVFVGVVAHMLHGALCVRGFPLYRGAPVPSSAELLALTKRALTYKPARGTPYENVQALPKDKREAAARQYAEARSSFLLKNYRAGSTDVEDDVRWVGARSPLVRRVIRRKAFYAPGEPQRYDWDDNPFAVDDVLDFALPAFGLSYAATKDDDDGDRNGRGGGGFGGNPYAHLSAAERKAAEVAAAEAKYQRQIGRFTGAQGMDHEQCTVRHVLGPFVVFRSAILGTFVCCRFDAEWVSKGKPKGGKKKRADAGDDAGHASAASDDA